MIYSLSGKLVHTESDLAVIECAGVGYACKTTFSTLQQIAGKSEVKLYTHLSVREDAVELFGFATKEELKSFRMLISVSGVGPKAGLAILSACTPSQFALAVLGYTEGEAMSVISKLDPNLSVEELIKKALIGLAKF